MIRIAVLSFWHVHAGDYVRQACEHPDTEVTAVWDESPSRGRREAEKRGLRFFASLDELLASQTIDAVIVNAPTSRHHEVMMKAAQAGKHIFTEKVLAPTTQEAKDILGAVARHGVKLIVSLPKVNLGYTLAIQRILAQRLLGELTLVRARWSHAGAVSGHLPDHFFALAETKGGALIDLGSHPMYLTRLFLGLPESVSAHYGYMTGREVEDNAVAVLKYKHGALGIVEAGFVNPCSPSSIEVHGQNGSLLYATPESRLLLRTHGSADWTEVDIPADGSTAFQQWIEHIRNDTVGKENLELALDLTKLMEASNLSAHAGKTVNMT